MSVPRGANRSSMSTVPIYTPRREETVLDSSRVRKQHDGIAKAQSRGLPRIKVTALPWSASSATENVMCFLKTKCISYNLNRSGYHCWVSSQCGTCKCRLRGDSHTAVHKCDSPSYIRHDLEKRTNNYLQIKGIVSSSHSSVIFWKPSGHFSQVRCDIIVIRSLEDLLWVRNLKLF